MVCSTCAALAVLAFSLATAHAVIFNVNNTHDEHDLSPGDGVCDAFQLAGNQCTLRAGVEETNALAGDDTIRLATDTIYQILITETITVNDNTGSLLIMGLSSILPSQITINWVDQQQVIFEVDTHLELQNVLLRDADNEFD